jgi:hypothetical protein
VGLCQESGGMPEFGVREKPYRAEEGRQIPRPVPAGTRTRKTIRDANQMTGTTGAGISMSGDSVSSQRRPENGRRILSKLLSHSSATGQFSLLSAIHNIFLGQSAG